MSSESICMSGMKQIKNVGYYTASSFVYC